MNNKYPESVEIKLWVESFRYSSSRCSYAAPEFCENYRQYYSIIPQRAKDLINQELREDIENHRSVRDKCDLQRWRSLLKFIKSMEEKKVSFSNK